MRPGPGVAAGRGVPLPFRVCSRSVPRARSWACPPPRGADRVAWLASRGLGPFLCGVCVAGLPPCVARHRFNAINLAQRRAASNHELLQSPRRAASLRHMAGEHDACMIAGRRALVRGDA